MKLAATTLGCPTWDIARIAQEYKKDGIQGLEIRGIGGVMAAEEIPCLSPEKWPETARLLEDSGVRAFCLGTSCAFHDPDRFDASVEEGKRAIEVAARIGADSIRVFGDQFPGTPEGDEAVFERFFRGVSTLCRFAKGTGVKVCHETHGQFNTIEVLSRIVAEMKSVPEFGFIWDVMHTDRAYGADFIPVYRLLRPYIHHLHVKDYLPTGQLVLCGEGKIPLPEIVRQLREDGFDGYLSFEWEKLWHPEIEDAEIAYPHYAAYFRGLFAEEGKA